MLGLVFFSWKFNQCDLQEAPQPRKWEDDTNHACIAWVLLFREPISPSNSEFQNSARKQTQTLYDVYAQEYRASHCAFTTVRLLR